MSIRAWLAAMGAAAVALEASAGAVALVELGPVRIALYPIACAVVTAAGAVALWRLLGGDDGGPGGWDGREDGDEDPPPPWWPQFERDLDEYARGRGRVPTGLR